MNSRLKRILLFAGVIAIALFFMWLLYIVFFRAFIGGGDTKTTANTANTNTTTGNVDLPSINSVTNVNTNGSTGATNTPIDTDSNTTDTNTEPSLDVSPVAVGGLTLAEEITSTTAQFPTMASDGISVEYYDRSQQRFFRRDFDGNLTALSDKTFPNVLAVTWAPDGRSAIIEFPDGSTISYDFPTGRQVTLPKEITKVVFSTDGSQIAYKFLGSSTSQRWVGISDPDGSNQQIIELIGDRANDVSVNWSPDGLIVAFYDQPIGTDAGEIFPIGQYGENFRSFVVQGYDFTAKWHPTANRIVYSTIDPANDFLPIVWVTDIQGDRIGTNVTPLNLTTWADKCVFETVSTIVCAVPQDLNTGDGIARELVSGVRDLLYRADLGTGRTTFIASPITATGETLLTVADPQLSIDGTYFYFRDENTSHLYRIRLKA